MNAVEWMNSKATQTEELIDFDGKIIKRIDRLFIAHLPYRMVKEVKYFKPTQTITGSLNDGNYLEIVEGTEYIKSSDRWGYHRVEYRQNFV